MKKPRHVRGHAELANRTARIHAVATFSGGLDSLLAALWVHRLGIDVTLLHVQHLFSADEHGRARLGQMADRVGLPLRIVDATSEQLEVVRHPKHGYGRGMNPCVDCHVVLLKVAKQVMEDLGAQFVVTGEVLGQRPKSQHYRALLQAAEESGLSDRLLRPLSANLLPQTLPVKEGWLRKEDLLAIQGRGREAQFKLAQTFGIADFPQPAGGCRLTEKSYAARVRDAFEHFGREHMGRAEFELLKLGRHFRLSPQTKVIIGRDEQENAELMRFAADRTQIEPVDVLGPTALVEGDPDGEEIRLAGELTARYSDCEEQSAVTLRIRTEDGDRLLSVRPLSPDDPRIPAWRIE